MCDTLDAARFDLRLLITESGLQHREEQLVALARPSLRLRAQQQPKPLGSRFRGRPDLPADLPWPMVDDAGYPMSFLLQVDLREAHAAGAAAPLPEAGLLSVFVNEGPHVDLDHFIVVHYIDGAELSPRPMPACDGIPERPPHRLDISAELTLPDYESRAYEGLGLNDIEQELYLDALIEGLLSRQDQGADELHHRMLGYPTGMQQGNLQRECDDLFHRRSLSESRRAFADPAMRRGWDDWVLLMQLDSDGADGAPGCTWADGGTLYLMIRRQELLARDFSRVQMIVHE